MAPLYIDYSSVTSQQTDSFTLGVREICVFIAAMTMWAGDNIEDMAIAKFTCC